MPEVHPEPIPFVGLRDQLARLRGDIESAFSRILDHGQFVNGPEIAAMEEALARYCGAPFAVGLSSGTDALLVALMALEVGPGDAVFVPSFTFTATAEVVLLSGAEPVFVDVDEQRFNLDPAALEAAIERIQRGGRVRPRVVLAVDLFGLPADYSALQRIADQYGMSLVADAAQSFGGTQAGRRVGSLTAVTTTSFFPAKPLGAYGDGGALFTDDEGIDRLARSIRQHGEGADRYDIARLGLNARLDSLQAAVILVKMRVFDEELDRRERLARRYDEMLRDLVELPGRDATATSAWAQYTIRVDETERDDLRRHLQGRGVPTAVYYPLPMHLQPAYARYGDGVGSLPTSESLCRRVLSLPMNPYLADEQIERVGAAVADWKSRRPAGVAGR